MAWRPTIADVLEEVPHCPACGSGAYRFRGNTGPREHVSGVTCRACNTDIMWFYQRRMDGFSQRLTTLGLVVAAIALIVVITMVRLKGMV